MESFFTDEDRVQLAFLRDEEVDELVGQGLLPEEARLGSPLEDPVQFPFGDLILHVTPGDYYPVLSEFNDFFRLENLRLGRVPCDALRAGLFEIYDKAFQANALSMWESREELNPYGLFERTMLILDLVSKTRDFLSKHCDNEKERLRIHHNRAPSPEPKKFELQTKRIAGMDVKSSSEIARELLGSPEKIVHQIPSWMRILHVEEILRADLAKKFKAKRVEMRDNISQMSAGSLSRFLPPGITARRAEDAVDKVLAPRLTFHGTKRSNVPSIVRYGFFKPGTALPSRERRKADSPGIHQVQQGSTYGQGVYSSPSAEFSLSYSGHCCEPTPANEYFGLKLIICATLMGRWARVDRSHLLREESTAMPNYDSHMANRDLEFVVFDVAQILPVYVIHLDWGESNDLHYYIPSDPQQWKPRQVARGDSDTAPTMAGVSRMAPGERQRAREAVMARASKWFPYGFGPKIKGNFIVEDVGWVSDDEEDYGDYQTMRMDKDAGDGSSSYWSWVKATEADNEENCQSDCLDEYKASRGGRYAPKSLDWDRIPLPGEVVSAEASDDDDLGIGALLSVQGGDDD